MPMQICCMARTNGGLCIFLTCIFSSLLYLNTLISQHNEPSTILSNIIKHSRLKNIFPSLYLGITIIPESLFSFFLLFLHIYSTYYLFIWLCQILVAACGIQFPYQGLNPGPLYWEHGVLATGPPGNSCFFLAEIVPWRSFYILVWKSPFAQYSSFGCASHFLSQLY